MRILLYADSGEDAGFGHVRRCEALMDAFQARGWQCELFSEQADIASSDAMVVDSYTISKEMLEKFAAKCTYLIGFHDFGEPNRDFSLLISSVYTRSTVKGTTHVLAGHEYKPIHPDIKAVSSAAISKKISSVVVTFGGSDVAMDLSKKVASALSARFPDVRLQIVAGMSGKDAAKSFSTTDIAISGGGQTMCELLYLGVPTIVVEQSEDQKGQIAEAVAEGAILSAGKASDPAIFDNIAENLASLYSKTTRVALRKAGLSYIDGKGAQRVAEAVAKHFYEVL